MRRENNNLSIFTIMKALFRAFVMFLSVMALPLIAGAQQSVKIGDIDIKELTVEIQQTPEFQAGNVKGKSVPRARDWLEVEVEFEVETAPKDAAAPAVMFRYYIALRGADGKARTLRGDVTHVNIPGNEEMYSAVYVSPSKLASVTGKTSGFAESDIIAIGVGIYVDGLAKSGEALKMPNGWWQRDSVQTEPGVLSRKDTPFALLWIDRYADEKEGGN